MFIKYKAWDKSSKRMAMVKSLLGLSCGKFTYVNLVYLNLGGRKNLPIGHVILLPFTGKKDKDGKEIYTDDILWVSGLGNCRVYFCEEYLHYTLILRNGNSVPLNKVFRRVPTLCKVVGNVYENPELF